MILVENGNIIDDDYELAETMNNYFTNITQTLRIEQWPEPMRIVNEHLAIHIIRKYENHPSILKIKEVFGDNVNVFELRLIEPEDVRYQIDKLNASRSSSGPLHTNILKDTIDIFIYDLT